MTIANPIAEAQGWICDHLVALWDGPSPCQCQSCELDRGARIMRALLAEMNRRLDDAAGRLLLAAADATDARNHIAHLEGQARRAFEDTRMWDDAEIDAFLRWPQ
jgi:hypothetical protein